MEAPDVKVSYRPEPAKGESGGRKVESSSMSPFRTSLSSNVLASSCMGIPPASLEAVSMLLSSTAAALLAVARFTCFGKLSPSSSRLKLDLMGENSSSVSKPPGTRDCWRATCGRDGVSMAVPEEAIKIAIAMIVLRFYRSWPSRMSCASIFLWKNTDLRLARRRAFGGSTVTTKVVEFANLTRPSP